ncbi:MAG: SDR family oxidoreductase [Rhodospirillaceae bacterium]|nr:SDR family oxidoreductase [Rhodospirillaceae bacterium]
MRLMKFVATVAAAMGLVVTSMATSAYAAGETVLVVGGGKSGLPLVKILKEQGYKVRLSVRDKSKAGDVEPGTEIVEADVTKADTLPAALKGVTYVISTIGAGGVEPPNNAESVDYKGVAALADASKKAGVKHFVLMSSINAGDDNPETFLNKRFGMVLMWKARGEEHLRKSGVPYTVVRPGGLQNCDPGKIGLKMGPAESKYMGRICRSDVGLVMTDALTNKDAAGKTVEVIAEEGAPLTAWKSAWAGIKTP